jgi:hypothetical protein
MPIVVATLPPAGKLGPANECIYSTGFDPHDDFELTKEHIIADGLGGEVELLKASCHDCAEKTSQIELVCLREMLQPIRQLLKLGRLRKPKALMMAKTSKSESLDDAEWREAQPNEYPLHLGLPVYLRPGLLERRKPAREVYYREPRSQSFLYIPNAREYEPGEGIAVESRFNAELFGRMLAKIAHSAAVALLGRRAFDPLLPQLIVGRYPFVSHLVGSPAGAVKPALDLDDITNGPLHEVTILRELDYFVAHVRLFAQFGFAGYEVVVGRGRD